MATKLSSAAARRSVERPRDHLNHFEDIESRHRRRLIQHSCVSIAVMLVFVVANYLIIPDVFLAAVMVSVGFIAPLMLLTVWLARRRRRGAAELALLFAFSGMPMLAFRVIGSSNGDPQVLALYGLGIASLMCIWCNATFGIRLWKPAVCYVLICVNVIAMFLRLRGLTWQSILCLALLTLSGAIMSLLANAFMQWDERGYVSEGERLLSAIIAGHHDLWAFDIPSGRAEVLRATPSGLRCTPGLDYNRYLSLVHPDDRLYVRDFVRDCIERGESRAPCQYRHKAGVERDCAWYEGIGKVVEYDLDGQPLTLFGITKNISDQKYLTRKLQQQSDEIVRATRAKSEFLATMSHEIRTPLNGILGMASLLGEMELTGDQQHMVSIIQSSGAILLRTLNDVLDFSKIEAGKLSLVKAPFELRDVVEHSMRPIEDSARAKSLVTAIQISPGVSPWLMGDGVHLGKVLTHLLSNAVKFTNQGSVELMVALRAPLACGMQSLRFAVRDTGAGIDPEVQKRLYTPFTQLHGERLMPEAGTGLGLAISKRIVEAMGGSIVCSSQPGRGTCFTLDLTFETCVPPQPTVTHKTGPARILIAEDNPVNQVIIQRMLENLGYSPTIVPNGKEAVNAVTNGSCDLVLMDWEMPVLSGLEATRQIRKLPGGEKLPIIALTAHSSDRIATACPGSEVSGYLAKPIDTEALRRTLARWL